MAWRELKDRRVGPFEAEHNGAEFSGESILVRFGLPESCTLGELEELKNHFGVGRSSVQCFSCRRYPDDHESAQVFVTIEIEAAERFFYTEEETATRAEDERKRFEEQRRDRVVQEARRLGIKLEGDPKQTP